MPENGGDQTRPPRGFWTGTLAFGLVSVPVGLFTATRPARVALRMVDKAGTPLSRRYFCSLDEEILEGDEIVRGYEVESDRYVLVEDGELEAIAPEKSQEIKLERFVAVDAIDPAVFERAYFLAPGKGGSRPYRLLARAMQDADRAGIATFVMRGKEYLVAIIAERGILRAETLRFDDELRTPDDVGLPALADASAARVRDVEKAIRALHAEALDEGALADEYADRIEDLVARKLADGEDVVKAPEGADPSEQASAEIIDLMQVLKQSLEDRQAPVRSRAAKRRGRSARDGLEQRSKAELYERAKKLDIEGRSGMSKLELIEAIRATG